MRLESCAFVYTSLENMESRFGFASPVTVQTLVLLYSNPAGCTSGSLPAAVHTDVGVQLK